MLELSSLKKKSEVRIHNNTVNAVVRPKGPTQGQLEPDRRAHANINDTEETAVQCCEEQRSTR